MIINLNREVIEIIHNYVVNRLVAQRGVVYPGMIQGSIDRSLTAVYGEEPFPTLFDRAGSLLYSLVRFHPFTDGNKRTGLLAAYFTLIFNGYILRIPEDSASFVKAVADPHNPLHLGEEDVIRWIRSHTRKSIYFRFMNLLLTATIRSGMDLGRYIRRILEIRALPFFDEEKFRERKT